MEYNKIMSVAKRYSFEEKVNVLFNSSSTIINIKKYKIDLSGKYAYPWELETLYIFFILAEEWGNSNFRGKNYKMFVNMVNCVRNYYNEKIEDSSPEKLLRNFLIINGPSQFENQRSFYCIMYRYNYIFSFENEIINMKQEFYNAFKLEYGKFLKFSFLAFVFFGLNNIIKFDVKKITEFLLAKNLDVVTHLIISREDCVDKVNEFAKNPVDYVSCVKPCSQYPFIKYKSIIYLVMPHCIISSCTSSLLFRLTDKKNKLRELIGKNVIEKYLEDILKESKIFDEVVGETEFQYRRNRLKSSDVMCRKEDKCVFFDSKLLVPKSSVRCLDEEAIDNYIEKICDGVKQLYKQLKLYFNKYLFPFKEKVVSDIQNYYGILVLFDDSYIERKEIYEKFAEQNNIDKESEDYCWIINNLKICSLYDVEKYVFTGSCIINSLIKQKEKKEPYNYPLSTGLDKSKSELPSFMEFRKKLYNEYYDEFLEELKGAGLV